MTGFLLQFDPDKIDYWADRYEYKDDETRAIETAIDPRDRPDPRLLQEGGDL